MDKSTGSGLAEYTWDPRVQRYRIASGPRKGTYVARQTVIDKLILASVDAEKKAQDLTDLFMAGEISPIVWYEAQKDLLKRQYLTAAAAAAGGWERLDARDFGHIGGVLGYQYAYLRNMAQEVVDGTVSTAQARNRTDMYYGGARAEYYLTQDRHTVDAPPGMMYLEKRILGHAKHCQSCEDWHKEGWQRRGVLPAPTKECLCGNNCRCTKIRVLIPANEESQWIGTRRVV